MFYAADNQVSTSPISGGIEITAGQYSAALVGMAEGKRVTVEDGQLVVAFPPEPVPEPQPEPTPEEIRAALHAAIDAERLRRIEQGRAFAVPGLPEPVHLQGRLQDQTAYLALLGRAQAMLGVDGANITLRGANDAIQTLTPEQTIGLITEGMLWFEQVMVVSWRMKDLTGPFADGLPEDITDDALWP